MSSSIPLPALAIRPPEQPQSPLDQFANVERIKMLMGQQSMLPYQQQEAQARAQEAQIGAQQAGLQLKAHQIIGQAITESGGDYDKALQIAQKNGADPLMLAQYREQLMTFGQKQREDAQQKMDLVQGAIDKVKAAPAEQKQQVYQSQLAGLAQMGLMNAGQMPPVYPGDDKVDLISNVVKSHTKFQEEAFKDAQTREATEKANQAAAETAKLNAEAAAGGSPQMQESRYRATLAKIKARQPITQADYAAAQGYEASQSKSTTQSDTLGVTSTSSSRPSGLAMAGRPIFSDAAEQGAAPAPRSAGGAAPQAPGGGAPAPSGQQLKENIVDMVGQYDYDPAKLSRLMIKHPELIGMIKAKYPDFDDTTYNAKNKLVQGYTSGTQSKEINAINTAMGHLKNLDDAVDALHNGDMTALNKIGTYYNINVAGKTPEAAFQLIARRVGPEVTAAYIPGAGGEGERIANEKDFDVNLPPQTLHNNAAITVKMLRSKISSLENQYQQTVGRNDFEQRFITPEAKASLQKFGGQQGGNAGAGQGALRVGSTVTIKGKQMTVTAVHPDGSFDAK